MMELVIGTVIMLVAATIAIFFILIAVNIVLLLRLRSRIPQKPFPDTEHVTAELGSPDRDSDANADASRAIAERLPQRHG